MHRTFVWQAALQRAFLLVSHKAGEDISDLLRRYILLMCFVLCAFLRV
jgi:hypothetical protein